MLVPAAVLAVLSIYQIGAHSFWRDEVASVVFAKASLPDLVTLIGRDREEVGVANMATYYLILHFWLAIGETEARIRFLSVLASVASVVPVFFLARRLAGRAAAAAAALLFALTPYVLVWSREARGYSLAMFATVALTWILLAAVERRSVLLSVTYGVVAALAIYLHFFVALVLVAHAAWVLLPRPRAPWSLIAIAAVPVVVALVPIPFIYAEHGGGHDWIPALSLERLISTLATLTGGEGLLVIMAALVAVAIGTHHGRPVLWLVAATALGPIILTLAVAPIQNFLLARYLVVLLPTASILAGVALVGIRPRYLRTVTAIGLAILLAAAVPTAYVDTRQQDWRAAARWVTAQAQPGDVMAVRSFARRPLDYYLERFGGEHVPEITNLRTALEDETPGRLWVVLGGLSELERHRVKEELSDRYEILRERRFGSKIRLLLADAQADEESAGDASLSSYPIAEPAGQPLQSASKRTGDTRRPPPASGANPWWPMPA